MGRKIENEGSTLIVSDSTEFDNLDVESMVDDIEETVAPLVGDYKLPNTHTRTSNEDIVYVEFKEEETDYIFRGNLNSYQVLTTKTGPGKIIISVEASSLELVKFPLGNNDTHVSSISFICGDHFKNIPQESFVLKISNIEKTKSDSFLVFIHVN